MEQGAPLRQLPDDELLRRTTEVVGRARRTEAEVVAHIAEVDERRLFARCACPSMFAYCVEVLHFSEAEAYLRIAAARASREHPMLLDMLSDGRLHLSSVARLAPHLTAANRAVVLARAVHRSKREVEELVAGLAPRPDAPAFVRRLPEPRVRRETRPTPSAPEADRQPVRCPGQLVPDRVAAPLLVPERVQRAIEPTSPGRYKVQFTATSELREKIERLRELMGAVDLAAVIDQAVSDKLARLEARRFALTEKPRPTVPDVRAGARSSRHIPAEVRRAVRIRDGGQCVYTDAQGRRCGSRLHLELHHRRPYGHGGRHTVENTCLLCSTHHALMTEADCAPRGTSVQRSHSSGGVA
jgi:5-methylcytosine-specific restriction endonuclease McrA